MPGLFDKLKQEGMVERLENQFADRKRCPRCKGHFNGTGAYKKCAECGMSFFQHVKRTRRRLIGGKRGRNSGTTNKSKSK